MYREYKKLFEKHNKEEEWMMEMYHLVCKERRRLEEQARVARKVNVFWSMFKNEISGLVAVN